MLDLAKLSSAFQPTGVDVLALAYSYALTYFDGGAVLTLSDRRCLARLTIMAGAARCRQEKRLNSFVDAHALSADVVDFFSRLKQIRAYDALERQAARPDDL